MSQVINGVDNSNNNNIQEPLKFTWPNNMAELGMTEDDRRYMEAAITKLGKGILRSGELPASSIPINFFSRKNWEMMCDGKSRSIPRSLYFSNSRAIVALNGHNGGPVMVGGAEQGRMKLAYDPLNGQYLVKKKTNSPASELFYSTLMFETRDKAQKSGFAEIALSTCGLLSKNRIFEVKYDEDLATSLRRSSNHLNMDDLMDLQNAVKKIHQQYYQPAILGTAQSMVNGRLVGGIQSQLPTWCFHGDISPRNILCQAREDGSKWPLYKLTDLGGVGDVKKLGWTPGWGSPETVAFVNKKKYQDLTTEQFNQKYGRKRDAWSFGLIILSLFRMQGLLNHDLPYASFISTRVERDPITGKLDDSEIMNVTQEEVDQKIDEVEKSLLEQVPEQYRNVCKAWCSCLMKWLKVDPDARSDLTQCYIG